MLPNFLVVGAAKAGTTSLYHYLKQHPEIYMSPIKEPYFFSFVNQKPNFKGPFDEKVNEEIITDLNDYKKLFANVTDEKSIGECSNSYLYLPESAVNIKRYIPKCKIIIILRNPIERAYSHYMQSVMLDHDNLNFEDAIEKEKERLNLNWRWHYQYTGQSLYYEQVKRYLDLFGKNKVKIFLFEELKKGSVKIMQEVFSFLEVDNSFVPNIDIYNATGLPKNRILHKFLRHNNVIKNITRPITPNGLRAKIFKFIESKNYSKKKISPIDISTKKMLLNKFKNDILKLQELIHIDLSEWLKI